MNVFIKCWNEYSQLFGIGYFWLFFFLNYYFCIIKYKRVYEPQKHILPHHAVKPFLHAFEFLHWPLPAAPSAHFFLFVFLSLYFVVLLHPMLITLLTLWLTNNPWENPTSSCSSGESDFHIERDRADIRSPAVPHSSRLAAVCAVKAKQLTNCPVYCTDFRDKSCTLYSHWRLLLFILDSIWV